MKVLSVNVGRPRSVVIGGRADETAIDKRPADGRVRVDRWGLDGDGRVERRGFGEDIHAVYAFAIEEADYWRRELGLDEAYPGLFGENLTLEGVDDGGVRVGDVLRRIGEFDDIIVCIVA